MIWIFLTLAAAGFFLLTLTNVFFWPRIRRTSSDEDSHSGALSVLIPARNEEGTIADCVRSALSQGPVVREVIVYDDGSIDATADVVRGLMNSDNRVRLVPASPLPAEWCGKPHACMRLSEHAGASWMLFLDADARLAPGAARALIETARQRGVTFLSAWPEIIMQGFAERLLMPMLNFFVFSVYPSLGALSSNDPKFGLAHGACVLVHRDTYRRLGGHGLVRNELFEDTMLARRWRELGEGGLGLDGKNVVRVRMYDSLSSIWQGFQKNFFPGFRSEAAFWGFLLLHFVLFLLPFPMLLIVLGTPDQVIVGGIVLLVLSMRFFLALRFGHPLWSVLFHPVAEGFLIAVGIRSWWRWSHGGVEWKGRTYSPRPAAGMITERRETR